MNSAIPLQPIMLEGQVAFDGFNVRLEPLCINHANEIYQIGQDPSIWKYCLRKEFKSLAEAKEWVKHQIRSTKNGKKQTFAIYDKVSGELAGCTRFLKYKQRNKTIEIGSTWYASKFQRTHINTEAKFLLLKYAFENLTVNRVQFTSDSRNTKCHDALLRLGALKEGVLRSHRIYSTGFVQDSVIFGITKQDWPGIKIHISNLIYKKYKSRNEKRTRGNINPDPFHISLLNKKSNSSKGKFH